MSILLRNRITGITTSTDLFGEDLALFLREYPDLVKVGIGTTANQPYYILLNETIEEFRSPYANNGLSYNPSTGTLSAGVFSGNGSGLSNVTATGSGIEIKDDNVPVGTARTVNFANNLSVTFASGIATVSGASSVYYATNAGIATYATSSGIATYATNAGIATYANNAGIATNLKGGVNGNIPYQSATNETAFLANGSSGQVLQSTGSGIQWAAITSTDATNATNIGITDDTSSNATRYLTFVSNTSSNNPANVSSSKLTFNPSTGSLNATKFVRSGGTSSQFLKADGTIDSSSYITLSNNYTQSGTNASPRPIQSKLSDVVSVKDFGAGGTGSTDDTASIQYAVDYATLNGKCVYFPAGIYPITSTISTTLSGDKSISFLGDGVGVSIIKLNPGGSGNGIEIYLPGEWWLSGAGGSNGFSMRGLTFETGILPSADSSGIKIIGDSYEGRPQRTIVISEIEFQGQTNLERGFKRWLHIVRQGDIKISNCSFRLDNQNLGTGMHVDDGGSQINSFSVIQITNTDFTYGNKSIEINDYFEGLYVTNCGFVATNYGIFCDVAGAESGMNLSNSHLNCNVCCVYLKGMVQSNISNNLIYANGGSGSIGIELLGNSSEYVITGNSIINLGTADYGIVIDGYNSPPRSSLIAANYIKGFALYGIWIKSGAGYLKVGDNHIWNETGVGLILKQSSNNISIFKQQFLESFVLNLNGTTEQIHDMAIPSGVFRVAPLLGIIQCNTDSRVLCRLNDGSTTSTNARIVINMIGGGNLPTGAHRFSVILSHLAP